MPVPRRKLVELQAAGALFLCAGGYGVTAAARLAPNELRTLMVVLAVPATATMMFLIAADIVPDLVGGERLAFPLNLTLPLAYAPLSLAATKLWTRTDISLASPPRTLMPALMWQEPSSVVAVAGGQIAVLSLLAFLSRPRHREEA